MSRAMKCLWISLTCVIMHASSEHMDDLGDHYLPDDIFGSVLQDDLVVSDVQHVKEDFMDMFGFFFDLSEEDIEKAYFTVHDYNNDSRLDGLELMNAMMHVHHEHKKDESGSKDNHGHVHLHATNEKPVNMEKVVGLVDNILKEDDKDQDGFIAFDEYMSSRQAKQHLKKKNIL